MEAKYILNKNTHVLHKYKFKGCQSSESLIYNSLKFDNPDTAIAYGVSGYALCKKCFRNEIAEAERMKEK